MAETEADESIAVDPEDAFAILGNETRMRILNILMEANRPLKFSEIYERSGYSSSSNFSFHLDKLQDLWVIRNDRGYVLSNAGHNVIEAILSGTITEATTVGPTELQIPCPICDGVVVVVYRNQVLILFCRSCEGRYQVNFGSNFPYDLEDHGYLGIIRIPPTVLKGRTMIEAWEATWIWATHEFAMCASGVCPRCAAPMESGLTICEQHRAIDNLCDECGQRYQTRGRIECTRCPFIRNGMVSFWLVDDLNILDFTTDHGINPLVPGERTTPKLNEAITTPEEEIVSTDPPVVKLTFTLDDESLTVTVDDTLEVVEAVRTEFEA